MENKTDDLSESDEKEKPVLGNKGQANKSGGSTIDSLKEAGDSVKKTAEGSSENGVKNNSQNGLEKTENGDNQGSGDTRDEPIEGESDPNLLLGAENQEDPPRPEMQEIPPPVVERQEERAPAGDIQAGLEQPPGPAGDIQAGLEQPPGPALEVDRPEEQREGRIRGEHREHPIDQQVEPPEAVRPDWFVGEGKLEEQQQLIRTLGNPIGLKDVIEAWWELLLKVEGLIFTVS